jgi:signal transduction histidine kinase
MTLERVEIDISSIVDSVISILNQNIIQKNITVIKEFRSDKNGFGDKNMVEMVIRNLITNAIKFTSENGNIWILLTENSINLQVEIRDNGIGISIDDQKKLFRIDSNFTTEGTKGERGTGLGLILCKEFIEKNKGKIWVESIPGKGSSFFFTIPQMEHTDTRQTDSAQLT